MKKKLAIACLLVFTLGLTAPAYSSALLQEPEKKEACDKATKADCDKAAKADCDKAAKADCDKAEKPACDKAEKKAE